MLEAQGLQHPPTLIFTGATASLKGSANFAAFASGKFALRALAQSLAREFGPKGVHVSHVIIDGVIDIPRTKAWTFEHEDAKLDPDAVRFSSSIDICNTDCTIDCRIVLASAHPAAHDIWVRVGSSSIRGEMVMQGRRSISGDAADGSLFRVDLAVCSKTPEDLGGETGSNKLILEAIGSH
jgi:NAD(P)-dependent dehydrogenase (short-subunit alcohol dehydrogenase family)